ncbi:MAG TPA: PilT/PilU family type 4a pilus ATPase, partial [Caldithrix sp.]|nr:PilT/PilU family type 4a pilus ATPase [Caldithrix sp.]
MTKNIIREILKFAVTQNASDVHFSSGKQPMLRIKGEFKKVDMPPIQNEILREELMRFLNDDQRRSFNEFHEVDLAHSIENTARFRINIYEHNTGIAGAFRIFPEDIRSIDELILPKVVKNFTEHRKGLVLVTGPTGSGKSTTLAAMIHEINITRRNHIITIEDPIEYIHQSKNCLIHQREIDSHTHSFESALRHCLREDPDVILVGEMRDIQTITLALHAAETGHLVLSTLHTNT